MKKVIIISGANLFSGGTLSIIQDCLQYIDENLTTLYRVIALVNDRTNFISLKNVELIEIPKARNSYFHRLYYEYFKYKSLSRKWRPSLWLSLNDMSSNVFADTRAVYCHNPSPFRKITVRDLVDQPKLFFFSLFYKYVYRINIHKNSYVVVQQKWIKEQFVHYFNLDRKKVIVAKPNNSSDITIGDSFRKENIKIFFYPAMARPFKNFEVIIEAVKILERNGVKDFTVVLTISGLENNYAKRIVKQAEGLNNIKFTGLLDKNKVEEYYKAAACLLFPSKLETWGLPITEFKKYNKPIFLADLPYAKETLGLYDKAVFFNPDSATSLADLMCKIIKGEHIDYSLTHQIKYESPYSENWKELFDILLDDE